MRAKAGAGFNSVSNAGLRLPLIAIVFAVALNMGAADRPLVLERYIASSWTHKDGLPSTLIHAIAQTSDGYLWLGTSDGLVRFDGINFIHQKLTSDAGLLLGAVTALYGAKDGVLWVGSASGFLTRIVGPLQQRYRIGAEIEAIAQPRGTGVWAITRNGIYRFDENPKIKFAPEQRIGEAELGSLLAEAPASSPTYVLKVNSGGRVFFLNEAEDGSAWLTEHSSVEDSNASIALRDRRGNVWKSGTDSGLIRVSAEDGRETTELGDQIIESLFEDREGNIWVGTNDGLSRFRFGKVFSLTRRDGLSSDRVSAIETTGSTVWVGAQNGLNRIDNLRGQWLLRGFDVLTVRAVRNRELWIATSEGVFTVDVDPGLSLPRSLTRDLRSVIAIEAGSEGCVWLLDSQKGLYFWENGALAPMQNKLTIATKTITAIRAKSDGALWVGFLEGGFGVYREGSFHDDLTVASAGRDPAPPTERETSADLGAGRESVALRSSSKVRSAMGSVHDIYVEKNDAIWFATDTGLYRFSNHKLFSWNTDNGLPGNRILWLQGDGDALWLGFSTGVLRVRRSALDKTGRISQGQLQFDFYDSGDGLFANPIQRSQQAARIDPEGRLWFTTSAGIALVDSRHIEKNLLPPPVVIDQVIADHREMPIRSQMYFPPLTRDLQIDYAGLSLVVPRKVRFRYRLEGYDTDWQNAGSRRQAFYTNLRPGNYLFRVVAANNDGVWNQTGATLNFAILPAFYQTWLFQILCLVAAAAIAWGLYTLRLHRMQAAWNARFEERLRERTRLAQDLHDELLQSAMGVSLQVEAVDTLIEDQHPAKSHVQRALTLSRSLMEQGRRVLRDLREKKQEPDDLTRTLSQTLKEAQRPGGPEARLTVEGQARALSSVISDEFAQIGRQAITNAFQHAKARQIDVHLVYNPTQLCLEIEDDGCGIEPQILEAGRPGHYGLIGIRERAERIRGTLTIASRKAEGTKVKLTVAGKYAYREETL
jgi:signal transduction histidine kinase/ligand-binding sensor domain-containing protein